jgi:hypothetical protein
VCKDKSSTQKCSEELISIFIMIICFFNTDEFRVEWCRVLVSGQNCDGGACIRLYHVRRPNLQQGGGKQKAVP